MIGQLHTEVLLHPQLDPVAPQEQPPVPSTVDLPPSIMANDSLLSLSKPLQTFSRDNFSNFLFIFS